MPTGFAGAGHGATRTKYVVIPIAPSCPVLREVSGPAADAPPHPPPATNHEGVCTL